MPQFASDLTPDVAGRNLGSINQPWNVFAQSIFCNGVLISDTLTTVAYSATPSFAAQNANGFSMTLTGNVTSSSLTGTVPAGNAQVLIFRITQDGTGRRTFAWPVNFKGAMVIDPSANATTQQLFLYDGVNAIAIAPGVIY